MSNALAVPTVTASIASLLRSAVSTVGLAIAPTVTTAALDDDANPPRVGVHLVRVSAAIRRVDDAPLRSADGGFRLSPRIPLELHYAISFHGTAWDTQTLLARSATALATEAVISPERITLAEADTPEIVGNDLSNADESVRLSFEWLSDEQIARLWSMFAPGAFVPILAVLAGPVVIDAGITALTPLPVAIPRVAVTADAPLDPTPTPPVATHRLVAVNPAMGPGSAPGLRSGTVTATVTPAVAKGAVVRLLLDARSVTAPFAVAPQVTTTSATGTVKFAIDDVPAGSYRALVEVDGVRGLPDRDAAGEWILVVATL